MSLVNRIRPTVTLDENEGALDEVAAQRAARVRGIQVEQARKNSQYWEELEDDLVERLRGHLVSAGSDRAFLRYPGAVWNGGGGIAFDHQRKLCFVVRGDNFVVMLEEQPYKWTEFYERVERRKLGLK